MTLLLVFLKYQHILINDAIAGIATDSITLLNRVQQPPVRLALAP